MLAVTLIKALSRASKLQRAIVIGAMRPTGLSVQIGLSPAVVVKFSRA